MKSSPFICLLLLSLAAFSCNKDSSKEGDEDTLAVESETASSAPYLAQESQIDASAKDSWTGFDFDSGESIGKDALSADGRWDIAVKRTSIKLKAPLVKIATIKGQEFDALTEVPSDGFVSDETPSDPKNETSGLAFHRDESWYSYDPSTHVVSGRGLIYILQSSEGRVFKLKILDYYSVDRLPGYLQIKWQEMPRSAQTGALR